MNAHILVCSAKVNIFVVGLTTSVYFCVFFNYFYSQKRFVIKHFFVGICFSYTYIITVNLKFHEKIISD
jgi:hypothetical protein